MDGKNMTFSLYDKIRMVEDRVIKKSKERELLWEKINSEGLYWEDIPDHEYMKQIEVFRVVINALMTERDLLYKTIEDDIIGKEANNDL
jgi:hypothetical protein